MPRSVLGVSPPSERVAKAMETQRSRTECPTDWSKKSEASDTSLCFCLDFRAAEHDRSSSARTRRVRLGCSAPRARGSPWSDLSSRAIIAMAVSGSRCTWTIAKSISSALAQNGASRLWRGSAQTQGESSAIGLSGNASRRRCRRRSGESTVNVGEFGGSGWGWGLHRSRPIRRVHGSQGHRATSLVGRTASPSAEIACPTVWVSLSMTPVTKTPEGFRPDGGHGVGSPCGFEPFVMNCQSLSNSVSHSTDVTSP